MFWEKYKKYLIIAACVILAVVIGISVFTSIREKEVIQKVLDQWNGQYFLIDESGDISGDIKLFCFKDGKFAYEAISEYGSVAGDIYEFIEPDMQYNANNNKILVWYDTETIPRIVIELTVNDQGQIDFYSDSIKENCRIVTLEEIEEIRTIALCTEHTFVEKVISAPTCMKEGKTEKKCSVCGQVEEVITTRDHNYVDDVCEMCGKTKERMKATISAYTWYTNSSVSALKMQNFVAALAQVRANGVSVYVVGKPFCGECLTFAKSAISYVIGFDEDIVRIHSCDVCGETSTYKLHLED